MVAATNGIPALDDTAWWLESGDLVLKRLRGKTRNELGVFAVNVSLDADGCPEAKSRLLDRIRAVLDEQTR